MDKKEKIKLFKRFAKEISQFMISGNCSTHFFHKKCLGFSEKEQELSYCEWELVAELSYIYANVLNEKYSREQGIIMQRELLQNYLNS